MSSKKSLHVSYKITTLLFASEKNCFQNSWCHRKIEDLFCSFIFLDFRTVCSTLFRIDKNFVKTDTVRNATHITRCSFLPPCIFLSSHLLFCRFTPFLLYQPKPLFILYSYKDVKSDKKEIQWWNSTMGWNIFCKKRDSYLYVPLDPLPPLSPFLLSKVYHISANSFRRNNSFLEVGVWQLFKGGNYCFLTFLKQKLYEETWIVAAKKEQ